MRDGCETSLPVTVLLSAVVTLMRTRPLTKAGISGCSRQGAIPFGILEPHRISRMECPTASCPRLDLGGCRPRRLGHLSCAAPVLAALWLWGDAKSRADVLLTFCAAELALGLNQAAAMIWYHPRPFAVPIGGRFVRSSLLSASGCPLLNTGCSAFHPLRSFGPATARTGSSAPKAAVGTTPDIRHRRLSRLPVASLLWR